MRISPEDVPPRRRQWCLQGLDGRSLADVDCRRGIFDKGEVKKTISVQLILTGKDLVLELGRLISFCNAFCLFLMLSGVFHVYSFFPKQCVHTEGSCGVLTVSVKAWVPSGYALWARTFGSQKSSVLRVPDAISLRKGNLMFCLKSKVGTAPAMKFALQGPQSTATKSALQGPQSI